jgi:tetratricopeptide (TPR) repeat protein
LTGDRDRLRRRLLAFAGLSLLLTGLLAAASLFMVALATFGVLLLLMLAAVGISQLRRVPLRRGLHAARGSTSRAFGTLKPRGRNSLRAVRSSTSRGLRALKPRVHGFGVRRRLQSVGVRAQEAASRAPGRINHVLVLLIRGYALAVYRLQWRTAQILRADGRLATSLSRLKPNRVGRSRQALALNELGARLRREGSHAEAAEQHRVALAIVRDLGDQRAEALTLNNLALALAQSGAEAEAVQHLEQALAVLRQLGDEAHEGPVIANLGIVHRRQGHSEEAVHLLHEALAKLPPESSAYRQVEKELRRAS